MGNPPLIVDTNVLIYEAFEDSEHHEEACRIVYSAESIAIPTIVIYEYVWLLTRKFKIEFPRVAEKVEQLLSEENIELLCEEFSDIVGALRIASEDRAPPSELNDYVIISIALRHKARIATYDKKLSKAASIRGLKTIPSTS